LLKVTPASYEAGSLGESFDISVWLLGDGLTDLDPFWDVAGIDVYMNFNTTLMQAISVDIDPDGEFASFWPNNLTLLVDPPEINNIDGYVRVAYIGVPGPHGDHTAPYGQINMFTVNFNATYESTSYPPPTEPITLKNPTAYTGACFFDSIGGLVNLASPVGSQFNELSPHFITGPKEMTGWEDNGDGELGIGDQIMLADLTTGFYFDYYINDLKGTLNVTLARSSEDYLWAASFGPDNLYYNGLPGRYVGTGDPYNGHGVPNWAGNFSMPYPVQSVNSITVTALPFTADEYNYTLTEGVDYIVHDAENTIELLHSLDVAIVNEHWVDGVNNTLNGWPAINYVASGIESVYVDMHNGTARFGSNTGYYSSWPSADMPPGGEWWFDPDFTWELESYWATGYFAGAFNWLDGSDWWINYTAASYMTIDYNTDPTTAFVDYSGTYADFLAVIDPTGTTWNEVYPKNWQSYTFVSWTDSDTSGDLSVGDWLEASGSRLFRVDGIGTDLATLRKPWICEDDPADPFFGVAPIVQVAGFPQPDNDHCPWHNKPYSVPLPHIIQDGEYTAPYKALGGFIDVYVCNYPEPFNGAGKDKPADMRWPQKDLCLCANVTYAGWPEQNKDVAFEIKFPNGTAYVVMYNRTNDVGVACVRVRLPWPCDDPEAIFGKWKVWATVDVACVVVNDTLEFKYDYRINIWNVSTNKDEYKHCEDIIITIDYGSYLIQTSLGHLIITATVTDASGVPIGFDYVEIVLGTDDMADWCQYLNGTVELSVHVVKWARPPLGTIYVGALTDFPQNGGSAETPVYITQVAIEAAWA
jgi:hypothetical protein